MAFVHHKPGNTILPTGGKKVIWNEFYPTLINIVIVDHEQKSSSFFFFCSQLQSEKKNFHVGFSAWGLVSGSKVLCYPADVLS